MKRVKNAIMADIRFQFRQGFYYVYIIIVILYIGILSQLSGKILSYAVPVVIFTDPSVLGFFFIGALIILEKQQGVVDYLVITPLKHTEYIYSKVLSLTVLASVASMTIAISSGVEFNVLILLIGVILSSLFFSLVGIIAVAGCRTVNQYFAVMIPYMLIIIVPALGLFTFPFSFVFRVFPTYAGLKLAIGAFAGMQGGEALLNIVIMMIWIVVVYKLADLKFRQKILYGEG